ncbi:MAG: hypothetical protein ACR2PH_17320, partial [Desulfobulbia bacterium]
MNIKRGVILTFVGRRINSISSAKIQRTYAKYGIPFTKQRLLRSTLTIAATLIFTSSGYTSTNTVSKKENDRTVNHRSLSDDNGRKWSRIFSKNTSIDSEKNLRLKIAQSSNIVDFISPFLKGFGYNKPQTPVKPLPTDNKPYQDNSAVQKQSEIPKVERYAKRPARAFCVRLCDGYYWP